MTNLTVRAEPQTEGFGGFVARLFMVAIVGMTGLLSLAMFAG